MLLFLEQRGFFIQVTIKDRKCNRENLLAAAKNLDAADEDIAGSENLLSYN